MRNARQGTVHIIDAQPVFVEWIAWGSRGQQSCYCWDSLSGGSLRFCLSSQTLILHPLRPHHCCPIVALPFLLYPRGRDKDWFGNRILRLDLTDGN